MLAAFDWSLLAPLGSALVALIAVLKIWPEVRKNIAEGDKEIQANYGQMLRDAREELDRLREELKVERELRVSLSKKLDQRDVEIRTLTARVSQLEAKLSHSGML